MTCSEFRRKLDDIDSELQESLIEHLATCAEGCHRSMHEWQPDPDQAIYRPLVSSMSVFMARVEQELFS